MTKHFFHILPFAALLVLSCQKAPAPEPADATDVTEVQEAVEVETDVDVQDAPQVDLSSLPASAVTVYTQGTAKFTTADILPLSSDSSGYTQKWEFYVYTEPYQARIKFEISNFAFSRNEGKINGYVKRVENGEDVEEWPISTSFKNGVWKADKKSLSLEFGDYKLSLKDGMFHLEGVYEHGSFSYDIPANPWKPGSGNVYFGNSSDKVFKYSILTYHQPVQNGVFVVDGQTVPVSGQAYANHYATTVAVYDMFDEVSDFRMRSDELLVEFRYYVPSAKYEAKPFGFMFVGYEGLPMIGSYDMTRTPVERWLDDQNYGYEIESRQTIEVRDGDNKAVFEMLSADPHPKDPYANLPAYQRNVASRFAKPIEYSIGIDWLLHLDIDGYQAKIPYSNTYTITRLRQ